MSEIDEFIKTARACKPVYLTAEEKQALRNHRAYLKLKAKDPDYYTKARREERRKRKEEQ